MNKYGNVKTKLDGITFDSKLEANRYAELKLLERAGEIQQLKLQPKFTLQDAFEKNGKKYRAIVYIADFMYFDNSKRKWIVEDTKGMKTDVYELKKKLFEYKFKNYEIKEITR